MKNFFCLVLNCRYLFCLVWMVSLQVHADNLWVLGSIKNEAFAEAQAKRLSTLIGAEVNISPIEHKGARYFRLLIVALDATQQQLLAAEEISPWALAADRVLATNIVSEKTTAESLRTSAAGAEASLIRAPMATVPMDTVPITRAVGGTYELVAASYRDVETALDAETKIASFTDRVHGKTVLVNGEVFYRIVVGPLVQGEIVSRQKLLVINGFNNSWLVNAAPTTELKRPVPSMELGGKRKAVSGLQNTTELMRVRGETKSMIGRVSSADAQLTKVDQTQGAAKVSVVDGFNLARLPETKQYFLNQ
ncbi:MAG: hypothetical protein KUG79_20230 [Pseudomonadales bacterium]|nr:hypothetical protein [Pseudomonadales bacterium]